MWVHNQKAAQPRSTFKDTAYWNPSIETDAQGKAHVEFVLPDNLTTWVVSAIGITEDTRVGQNMNEIVVSKEVIIRPTLPNILYIDDSLVISADIQNYSEKNLKFDISLNFDSGSVSTKEYPNIQIKSKDTYKAEWRVIPRQENEKAKLTFSAISGSDSDLSDIIILEIPVRKPGFQVKQTFTGIDDKEFEFSLPPDEDQSKTSITLELSSTVAGTLCGDKGIGIM
ncbi:MAG: alpha-2-macroglobulin family protein [Spirochaetia bacterium]